MKNGKGKRPDFSSVLDLGLCRNGSIDENALDIEAAKQLKALGETALELREDLQRLAGSGSSLDGRRYTQAEAFGEGGWTGMSITGPRL